MILCWVTFPNNRLPRKKNRKWFFHIFLQLLNANYLSCTNKNKSFQFSVNFKRGVEDVFSLYVLYPEIRTKMNMHKAKRYMQVTWLTCVSAAKHSTRQMFSPSLLFRKTTMRKRGTLISGEPFFHSVNEKLTH